METGAAFSFGRAGSQRRIYVRQGAYLQSAYLYQLACCIAHGPYRACGPWAYFIGSEASMSESMISPKSNSSA